MSAYLGVELGSTRIKAMKIDEKFSPVSSGAFNWKSSYDNGIWTYPLDLVWEGLKKAIGEVENREEISAMGISAMMHGYLAFDKDWNLLAPFRTWQNTITAKAAAELTALFGFNVPQRWSIAHLYQAVLNGEEHVKSVAHITTLAGYVHYMLTGVNAIGVGEASGMFPIDSEIMDYDKGMIEKFQALTADMPWDVVDLLPKVLVAGEDAGVLTAKGAELIGNLLPVGIPFAPAEGDAGTGMTATNAVGARTGNVSAGTSIFAMVVLEKPLKKVYEEIDMVTTPSGRPVAMVHCNNCTGDMNAWVDLLHETMEMYGGKAEEAEFFRKIYKKSLEGDADCGGVTVFNYQAGEGITHLDEGRPLVVREPGKPFGLANFLRAQLYSTFATLAIGMRILEAEQVKIDRLMGHGGVFKVPGVGQSYLAAACKTSVTCMSTAGEGGAYGMALLAAYLKNNTKPLEAFLEEEVFASCEGETLSPDDDNVKGFNAYLDRFEKGLAAEKAAIECF